MKKRMKIDFSKPDTVKADPGQDVFVDDSANEIKELRKQAIQRSLESRNAEDTDGMQINAHPAEPPAPPAEDKGSSGRFGALMSLLGPSVANASEVKKAPVPVVLPDEEQDDGQGLMHRLKYHNLSGVGADESDPNHLSYREAAKQGLAAPTTSLYARPDADRDAMLEKARIKDNQIKNANQKVFEGSPLDVAKRLGEAALMGATAGLYQPNTDYTDYKEGGPNGYKDDAEVAEVMKSMGLKRRQK